MAELPRTPAKVAVLVNPTKQEAIELAELPFIDALQLHGDESREFCESLAERGIRFFKAFAATDAESLRNVSAFFTQTVLLDSRSEEFSEVAARPFRGISRERALKIRPS